MANEEKNDDAKAELSPEELAEKKRKRKRLLIIVGGATLILLLCGVGFAFFAKVGPFADKDLAAKDDEASSEEVAEESAEGEEVAEGEEPAEGESDATGEESASEGAGASSLEGVDMGCTYAFEPFHLNLGNPLENRYIRLGIAVEYGCGEEHKLEIERRIPQLRDAIIEETSLMTRDYLLGPKGKPTLRRKILKRVNQYMTKKVEDVFITDILIE